jgi:hypothetical protein
MSQSSFGVFRPAFSRADRTRSVSGCRARRLAACFMVMRESVILNGGRVPNVI